MPISLRSCCICRNLLIVFLLLCNQNVSAGGSLLPSISAKPPQENQDSACEQGVSDEPKRSRCNLGAITDIIRRCLKTLRPSEKSSKSIPALSDVDPAADEYENLDRNNFNEVSAHCSHEIYGDTVIGISEDGQWISIGWNKLDLISIHNIANPEENYTYNLNNIPVLSLRNRNIKCINKIPERNAVSMIIGHGKDREHIVFVDFESKEPVVETYALDIGLFQSTGHFSPDRRLITAYRKGSDEFDEFIVYNWIKKETVFSRKFKGVQDVKQIIFEDNDNLIVGAGFYIYRIHIKDEAEESESEKLYSEDVFGEISRLSLSEGKGLILSTSSVGTVVYSRKDNSVLLQTTDRGDAAPLTSKDDKTLYLPTQHHIAVHSINGDAPRKYITVAYSPTTAVRHFGDGNILITGHEDGSIRFIDISTEKELLHLPLASIPQGVNWVKNIWITSDHNQIISQHKHPLGLETRLWHFHDSKEKNTAEPVNLQSLF